MQLLFLYGRVMITLLAQPVLLPGKAAAMQGRGILGKHNEKQAESISNLIALAASIRTGAQVQKASFAD